MKKLLYYSAAVALLAVGFSGCQSSRQALVESASVGNAYSQAVLAGCYLNGYGFKVDYRLAAKWASDAAAQNDPDGMYVYGIICEHGYGDVEIDHAKAQHLYRNAIPGLQALLRKGSAQGQFDLGCAYLYGRGLKRDYISAQALLEAAAERGFAPAYAKLGLMHLNGWGFRVDLDKARKLLLRAAQDDIPEAQTALAGIYLKDKNFHAARNWFQDAADLDYPPAITALAEMYRDGIGVKRDPVLADGLIRRAADLNYPPAITMLANAAAAKPASRELAIKLYNRAIAKDYASACLPLGNLYYQLHNEKLEYAIRAMVLYQLAANYGAFVEVKDRMIELDRLNGLFYFVKFSWKDIRTPSCYLKYDSNMPRILAGYLGGMEKGSYDLFRKSLSENPLPFYFGNDWFEINRHRLPLAWAGDIFQAVAATQADQPFYWLCYGTCANLAGRPELAMTAVQRLDTLVPTMSSLTDAVAVKNLSALIRTSALIQRGMEKEAYDRLFVGGRFTGVTEPLNNYIRFFAPWVLKDREKFAMATGIKIDDKVSIPPLPQAQPFYDVSLGATVNNPILAEPTVKPEAMIRPSNK